MTNREKNMNTLNSITRLIIAVALTALVLVAFMQSAKWLKQSAVQGCLQVGRDEYIYPETNTKAVVPNIKAYEDCMIKKGY